MSDPDLPSECSEPLVSEPRSRKTVKTVSTDIYLQRCISLFPFYALPTSSRCDEVERDSSVNTNPQDMKSFGLQLRPLSSKLTRLTATRSPLPELPGFLPSLTPLHTSSEIKSYAESVEHQRQLIRVIGSGVAGVVILATEVATIASQQLSPIGRERTFVFASLNSNTGLTPTRHSKSRRQCFVVKFVDLEGDNGVHCVRALREIECLTSCDFFFITRCYRNYVRRRNPNGETNNVTNPIIAVALELEYANNGDLRQEIKTRTRRNKPFTEREALLLFLQVILAVHYLHKKGIIHRDIKAANVFLYSSGLVKLGDFGLSKFLESGPEDEKNSSFVGTPYYIAPEILRRKAYGKKADMFSLGVLLYELLSLRRPFKGADVNEVIQNAIHKEVEISPSLHPEVSHILSSLLSKDAASRPSAIQVLSLPLMRVLFAFLLQKIQKEDINTRSSTSLPVAQGNNNANANAAGLSESVHVKSSLGQEDRRRVVVNLHEIHRDIFTAAASNLAANSPLLFDDLSSSSSTRVIMEGMVYKGDDQGNWKSRYLCLQWIQLSYISNNDESTDTGDISIILAVQPESTQRVSKSMSKFIDCFPVPERYAPKGASFMFTLLSTLGSMISFRANSEIERERWVNVFIKCIEHTKHELLEQRQADSTENASMISHDRESTFSMSTRRQSLQIRPGVYP